MPASQNDVIIKINNNNSNEGTSVSVTPNNNLSKLVPEINKTVSRTDFYNKLKDRFKEDTYA